MVPHVDCELRRVCRTTFDSTRRRNGMKHDRSVSLTLTVGDGLFFCGIGIGCWYRCEKELGGGLPFVAVDDLARKENRMLFAAQFDTRLISRYSRRYQCRNNDDCVHVGQFRSILLIDRAK